MTPIEGRDLEVVKLGLGFGLDLGVWYREGKERSGMETSTGFPLRDLVSLA